MTFDEFIKDRFVVNSDGKLCRKRYSKLNNGFWLHNISFEDLEEIWDYQQRIIDDLKLAYARLVEKENM